MSKICGICGKTGKVVWQRVRLRATKYNPTCKKKQQPNLQSTTLPNGEKITACTRCIRTINKNCAK